MQILNMRFSNLKQDKGVAGLSILLSLIVMLFIIGLIVMIFSLMGAELKDATYESDSATLHNEEISVNATGDTLSNASAYTDFSVSSIVIFNATKTLESANYTYTTAGVITNVSTCGTDSLNGYECGYLWDANYTFTYNVDSVASNTIEDTTSAIGEVTDWFSIFIVIGAMVVLILLTVIIITAIRGSGMIQTEGQTNNVGSA